MSVRNWESKPAAIVESEHRTIRYHGFVIEVKKVESPTRVRWFATRWNEHWEPYIDKTYSLESAMEAAIKWLDEIDDLVKSGGIDSYE